MEAIDMNFDNISDPDHFHRLMEAAMNKRKEIEMSEPQLESMRELFAQVEAVIAVYPTDTSARDFTIAPLKGCDLVRRYRNGQSTIGPVRWVPMLIYSTLEAQALSVMFGDGCVSVGTPHV
jgi:hypothetical protein